MKSVNVSVAKSSISLQLFDKWYAYRQSLFDNGLADVSITFDPQPKSNCLNIWFEYMPTHLTPRAFDHDFIWLCNGGEPTIKGTLAMQKWLEHDRVYLCCDGLVTNDHPLVSKIIWFPHDPLNVHDYWTRSFYPQFYTLHDARSAERLPLVGINGSNRTWRHLFWSLVSKHLPHIPVRNSYPQLKETTQSQWESAEDNKFRQYLIESFPNSMLEEQDNGYYSNSSMVGINGKFGSIPPGYFFIDEYFDFNCVIFPETTWQNDELCLTEKGLKCFYAESLPMPVGGRHVNALYNSLGFSTAWNLLPKDLQVYDSIEDHVLRYQKMVQAIQWLDTNSHVLECDLAREMKVKNKIKVLTTSIDHKVVAQFDSWISGLMA